MDKEVLHVYYCREGHRLYRKTQGDTDCARCGATMDLLATVPRKDGESESQWKVRAIRVERK